MSTKEIVTLQVGHYSNFVGAHWWNIQESSFVYSPSEFTGPKEICHDVLYREGQNMRREVTFTPRLVAFDLKGSLKTLKKEGVLYETGWEGEEIQWLGDVTMHKEEAFRRNTYLKSLNQDMETEDSSEKDSAEDKEWKDSDSSTKRKKVDHKTEASEEFGKQKIENFEDQLTVWSDFLGTHFHPKSIHVVEEFKHRDEFRQFDLYNTASEVLSNYETTCDWEDRIHFFTEECDSLQGFHVLTDTHDGFGGLGAGLVRYLEDEFPGKGILTFGFTPADVADDLAQVRVTRIINSALAYENISNHSSLFVPASLASGLWRAVEKPVHFPYLTYRTNPYHTSAILAATLDTLSSPYRMDSGGINLRDITHSFNAQGRKISTINASFPLGLYENESLTDYFSHLGELLPWQPLTPHVLNNSSPFMQSLVLRGMKDSIVASQVNPGRLPKHLVGAKTRQELMSNFLEHRYPGSLFVSNCLENVLKTATPFPQFFTKNVAHEGLITSGERPEYSQVEATSMMTSLQCTPEVGGVIQHLYDAAAKLNIKKHHRYLAAGLEEDDYSEVLANLKILQTRYKTDIEAL